MFTKTRALKCTAVPTLLGLVLACGTLTASAARPAAADVVTFDNSDGQFTWILWIEGAGDWYGNLLDPTLGPLEQDSADPARGYAYWHGLVWSSTAIAPGFIECGGNAAIARDTEPILIRHPESDYELYVYLATRFYTPIGPAANWQPEADTAWFCYCAGGEQPMLGQTCTAGIRLNLADGMHYGFINFVWRPRDYSAPIGTTGMYQPVAWGYETNPDTPIMICEIDFNTDGVVNSQDFFDFLNLYFASDPRADFDHSGSVDSQDFFTFLSAFFVGCS